MNYTVVGKTFWFGIMNAILLSAPMWFLLYFFIKLFI